MPISPPKHHQPHSGIQPLNARVTPGKWLGAASDFHRTCRLLVFGIEAPDRAHLIVRLAIVAGLVCRVLGGVFRHVLCRKPISPLVPFPIQCNGSLTLDLCFVALGLSHQQSGSLAVQGIGRVGIPQELRQEDLENVDHVEHRRPSLVDDVKADGARP